MIPAELRIKLAKIDEQIREHKQDPQKLRNLRNQRKWYARQLYSIPYEDKTRKRLRAASDDDKVLPGGTDDTYA